MQSLLFEVTPREGHENHYFRHAAKLRPLLMRQDGLVFLERFKSLSRANVILSHSLWRDESSIARWRADGEHHKSQTAGRREHFLDYRIRISHLLQRYVQATEIQRWSKSGLYNDSEVTPDRFLVVTATEKLPMKAIGEVFESVTAEHSFLTLCEVASEQEGRIAIAQVPADKNVTTAHLSRVSRDYGMYDRTEAPQYFPPRDK